MGDGRTSVELLVYPNVRPTYPPVETIAEPSMLELHYGAESSSTIDTINNIFGGAEVLES